MITLRLVTSAGIIFDATHVRLFPSSLIEAARKAASAGSPNGDMWLVGNPVALLTAKAVVNKLYNRADLQKLEHANKVRQSLSAAGKWFEISDAEIDLDEGLGSLVASELISVKVTPPDLSLFRAPPKPELQTRRDFFLLRPDTDLIRIRTVDSEYGLRLSSIVAFSLERLAPERDCPPG